jgi:tRNA modification GTPase
VCAGEFTLRAFLNGRLDLAQAESVAQVVAAKTSAAAETALAGIQGGLSSFVQSLRMECIDLLVEMEARLDFDDEMPILDTNALIGRVETMSQRLQQALATAGRGHLLQSGLQVINGPLIPSFLLSLDTSCTLKQAYSHSLLCSLYICWQFIQ